jgi:hypothetical protein
MRFLAILVFYSLIFHTSSARDVIDTSSKVIEIIDATMKLSVFKRFENTTLFTGLGLHTLPYASAILSVFRLLRGFLRDDDENTFENEVLRQLDQISEKLDEISSSIGVLEQRILTELNWVVVEMKTAPFRDISINLAAAEHFLTTLINSHNRQSAAFIARLDQFIEQQEREANEFKLVALFDGGVSHSQSIVDEIIQFGRQQSRTHTATLRTSTAKMIYDFYADVLTKILRSYNYRELAINLKYETFRHSVNSINFLMEDKRVVLEMLEESFKQASRRFTDDDFKAFLNLRENGEHRMVKFKNVFQTYMEAEPLLETAFIGSNTCSLNCHRFQRVRLNSTNGCRGTARNCIHEHGRGVNRDRHPTNYIRVRNPRSTDRIMEAYLYYPSNDWFGLSDTTNTTRITMVRYELNSIHK